MSTEEAARGAVGLPRGGPEESEGGQPAAPAAAAEPLALAVGWEDWPEEVWAEFRRGAEPLTWNRAQRIAGRVCREGSLRYGRESSERFKKFELVMSEAFGPGWRIRAQREEVFAKRRLELEPKPRRLWRRNLGLRPTFQAEGSTWSPRRVHQLASPSCLELQPRGRAWATTVRMAHSAPLRGKV